LQPCCTGRNPKSGNPDTPGQILWNRLETSSTNIAGHHRSRYPEEFGRQVSRVHEATSPGRQPWTNLQPDRWCRWRQSLWAESRNQWKNGCRTYYWDQSSCWVRKLIRFWPLNFNSRLKSCCHENLVLKSYHTWLTVSNLSMNAQFLILMKFIKYVGE